MDRMPMTLDEITAREDALLDQIAECKRLLAAYQLIRADCERSVAAAAPAPEAPQVELAPVAVAGPPVPSSAAVPAPAVNLHLLALSRGWAGTGRAVSWVLRQMTGDFTVHDVAAVLRNEGCPIPLPKLSVVLNRMKIEREITEIRRGQGRTPTLFRAEPAPPWNLLPQS